MESLYLKLIGELNTTDQCIEISRRIHAGITFLSILPKEGATHQEIEQLIGGFASQLVDQTELYYDIHYVRTTSKGRMIFRFRFRVPNEKSFCCGNQCVNCILLRAKK